QVPGGAAEIGEGVETAEVEGPDDGGGSEGAEAVHAAEELPLRALGLEEAAEDGAVPAEGLMPAGGAFADGVREVAPHGIESAVGIVDVAGEGVRAGGAQEGF